MEPKIKKETDMQIKRHASLLERRSYSNFPEYSQVGEIIQISLSGIYKEDDMQTVLKPLLLHN